MGAAVLAVLGNKARLLPQVCFSTRCIFFLQSTWHALRRLVTKFVFLFRASSLFSPPGTPGGVSFPGLFCFSLQKLWRERPILRGGSEQHASKRFLTVRSTAVAPAEEGNTQRKTFMPCTTSLFPAENRAQTFKPSRRLLQEAIFSKGKVVAD